jgi:hypothetical protein
MLQAGSRPWRIAGYEYRRMVARIAVCGTMELLSGATPGASSKPTVLKPSENLMSTISASAPSAQTVNEPVNQAAVVDAALRAIYSVYPPSQDFVFSEFAKAIKENREAKEDLEELLHTLGSDEEEEDGRTAFGVGMVAGMLYAASTGITLAVPPLNEVKSVLDAQEALWAAMRKAADAPQVV